jgi:hypothetical protein
MAEDYIEAAFGDLDKFYPGSKRKRREFAPVEVKDVASEEAWDARPYLKPLPNGIEIEMFTVGALALALGRPFITVRTWNKKGYLPTPPYRLPTKKDKNGKEHKGRRLYSRAMIEAAVELFSKFGVLQSPRIDWSTHQQLVIEIAEAWSKILAEETNTH